MMQVLGKFWSRSSANKGDIRPKDKYSMLTCRANTNNIQAPSTRTNEIIVRVLGGFWAEVQA